MPSHGNVGHSVDLNFVDIRRTQGATSGVLTNPNDFVSTATIETKLLASGFTQATLNKMTSNDKVYALRLVEESAGIK